MVKAHSVHPVFCLGGSLGGTASPSVLKKKENFVTFRTQRSPRLLAQEVPGGIIAPKPEVINPPGSGVGGFLEYCPFLLIANFQISHLND